jgi:hypothetical protein
MRAPYRNLVVLIAALSVGIASCNKKGSPTEPTPVCTDSGSECSRGAGGFCMRSAAAPSVSRPVAGLTGSTSSSKATPIRAAARHRIGVCGRLSRMFLGSPLRAACRGRATTRSHLASRPMMAPPPAWEESLCATRWSSSVRPAGDRRSGFGDVWDAGPHDQAEDR